jgi:hypothetical protein
MFVIVRSYRYLRGGNGPTPAIFLNTSTTSASRGSPSISHCWSSGISGVGSTPRSFLYCSWNCPVDLIGGLATSSSGHVLGDDNRIAGNMVLQELEDSSES